MKSGLKLIKYRMWAGFEMIKARGSEIETRIGTGIESL